MALKKNKYFSHDYNAHHDLKLKKLIMNQGLEGYGIYWYLVELFYENDGYIMADSLDVLAYDIRVEKEKIISILENYDLFEFKDNQYFSTGVLKRIDAMREKSEKARKSAARRWESESNANAYLMQCYKNKINKNKIKEICCCSCFNNIKEIIKEKFEVDIVENEEIELLAVWVMAFDEKIIKEAIRIAIVNRKKTLAYVNGILCNWKKQGIKNISQIKQNTDLEEISNNDSLDIFDYDWINGGEEENL